MLRLPEHINFVAETFINYEKQGRGGYRDKEGRDLLFRP